MSIGCMLYYMRALQTNRCLLTCAVGSISSEPIKTGTVKATNGVSADGKVHVTIIERFKTLINIFNVAEREENKLNVLT